MRSNDLLKSVLLVANVTLMSNSAFSCTMNDDCQLNNHVSSQSLYEIIDENYYGTLAANTACNNSSCTNNGCSGNGGCTSSPNAGCVNARVMS